ncbi:MAG: C1 family peptidase [Elusimicrobiota bacterium]
MILNWKPLAGELFLFLLSLIVAPGFARAGEIAQSSIEQISEEPAILSQTSLAAPIMGSAGLSVLPMDFAQGMPQAEVPTQAAPLRAFSAAISAPKTAQEIIEALPVAGSVEAAKPGKKSAVKKRSAVNSLRRKLSAAAKAAQQGSRASLDAIFDEAGSGIARRPSSAMGSEISPDWVRRMRNANKSEDPSVLRLRDAAERVGFTQIALNRGIIQAHNDKYTVTIPDGVITNQKQSGRCWIFAGLNMIRSELLARNQLPEKFEFSENYIYFFSMLEKSNRYLEQSIGAMLRKKDGTKAASRNFRDQLTLDDKLGDGGWFDYFQFLVAKYGLAPKSAMGETTSSQTSSVLSSELKNSIALSVSELLNAMKTLPKEKFAREAIRIKSRAMARVWKVLTTHLGTPPEQFDLRLDSKPVKIGPVENNPAQIARYTPVEFAKSFIRFNPDDYVTVVNYPRIKNGVVYEIPKSGVGIADSKRRVYNLRFMQVGPDRLEQLAAASIKNGRPSWFAADITKDVDYQSGIMHPEIFQRDAIYGFSPSEKKKKLSRDWATYLLVTGPNHAMALTGYDQPDPNTRIVKFRVENSWGETVGSKGVFHMYREWFRRNVYQVIVHKSLLTPAEKKAWAGKAEKIKDSEDF